MRWFNFNKQTKFISTHSSLLNGVGCMITWVAWVRGLLGSNFYVGDVGQNIFYVGQIFFALVNFYLLDEIILPYYN